MKVKLKNQLNNNLSFYYLIPSIILVCFISLFVFGCKSKSPLESLQKKAKLSSVIPYQHTLQKVYQPYFYKNESKKHKPSLKNNSKKKLSFDKLHRNKKQHLFYSKKHTKKPLLKTKLNKKHIHKTKKHKKKYA
jgi:hypothetical protein